MGKCCIESNHSNSTTATKLNPNNEHLPKADNDVNQQLFLVINRNDLSEDDKIAQIQNLLGKGADINAQEKNSSDTMYHLAITKKYKKLFRSLFHAKAKLSIANGSYETAGDLLTLPENKVMQQIHDDLRMDIYDGIIPIKSRGRNVPDDVPYRFLDPALKKVVELEKIISKPSKAVDNLDLVMFSLKVAMILAYRAAINDLNFRISIKKESLDNLEDIKFASNERGQKGEREYDIYYEPEESKKISLSDLISTDMKSKFSLLRYFEYYQSVRRIISPDSSHIVVTNVDFGDLGHGVKVEDVTGYNSVDLEKGRLRLVKLSVDKYHQLYAHLKQNTREKLLARILLKSDKMDLTHQLVSMYHLTLSKHVIDIDSKKFKPNFINNQNLEKDVREFRDVLKDEFLKLKDVKPQDKENFFKDEISRMDFKLSPGFGKLFELKADTKLKDVGGLVQQVVSSIKAGEATKIVRLSNSDELKKLAGHLIVRKDDGKLGFSYKLFEKYSVLPKDVVKMRKLLEREINFHNIDLRSLQDYVIEIEGAYETCEDGQVYDTKPTFDLSFTWLDTTDTEIEQFFQHLTFSVNFPTGDELDETLNKIAGKSMKITSLDRTHFGSGFESDLLQWIFNQDATNYKSGDNLKKWIVSLDNKIEELGIEGFRYSYPEKLSKIGMRFEKSNADITKFILGQMQKRILFANTNNRLMGSSMALQGVNDVRSMNILRGLNNVIFVREHSLLSKKEKVLDAFSTSPDINVLIIEGATMEKNSPAELSLTEDIVKIVKGNPKKRVLVIGEDSANLPDYLKSKAGDLFSKVKVELKLNQLSAQSKNRLDNIEVIFQGHRIRAKEVFAQGEPSPANLRRIVYGGAIIGQHVSESHNFLMPLSVSRHIELKGDILKANKNERDTFALTEVDKKFLQKQLGAKVKVNYFDEMNQNNGARYVILDSQHGLSQFAQLEKIFDHSRNNLHWLSYDNSKQRFTWIRSVGDVKGISNYATDANPIFQSFIPEGDLLEASSSKERGVSVIEGESGAGKSAMLGRLAVKVKKQKLSHWVLKVNLNDCFPALNDEIQFRRTRGKSSFNPNDRNEVINFVTSGLLRKNERPMSRLDGELLRGWITSGHFSIVVDGYGTLNGESRSIVHDVLPTFKGYQPQYLIVTATPNVGNALKRALGVGSYRVDPLSESKQIDLMAEYWSKNSHVSGETDFKGAAKNLLGGLRTALRDPRGTERPVIIEIAASAYANNIKQINSGKFGDLPPMNKFDLFNKYLTQEFRNYYIGKGYDANSLAQMNQLEVNRKALQKDYGQLALYYFNDPDNLRSFFPDQAEALPTFVKQVKNRFKELDLIPKIVNEKANFVSHAMGDYFHTQYIAHEINEGHSNPKFIRYVFENVLLQPYHAGTRSFLNGYLREIEIEKFKLLERYGAELNTIWTTDKNKLEIDGKNIIRVALDEDHSNIINFLIRCGRKYPKMLTSLTKEGKTPNGATPLHLAAKNLDSRTLKVLINEFHSIEGFDANFRTPLHYAVEGGNPENIKILLEAGSNMHAVDRENISPLEDAIIKGKVDIISEFTRRSDWKLQDDNSLHLAAKYGHYKVVKYLVENDLSDITKKDVTGKTAIDYAQENNHGEVVTYLKNESILERCLKGSAACLIQKRDIDDVAVRPESNIENIRIQDQKFWPKYYELEQGEKRNQFMQLMSEVVSNRNWPEVLHGRDKKAVFDKIRRFKQYKALKQSDAAPSKKINLAGYSILHGLAEFDQLQDIPESMSHLVNARDIYGNTPLHYAADSGNEKAIDVLIRNGAKATELNLFHESALHFAAKGNNPNIVIDLLAVGGDKFQESNFGDTPVQIAAKTGDIKVLRTLAHNDERVEGWMISGHIAASGNMEKLRFLETKYKITTRDTYMMDQAAQYGHSQMVSYLISKKVPINHNMYYAAARSGNLDTLKKLGFPRSPKDLNWVVLLRDSTTSGNLDLVKSIANTPEGKTAIKKTYYPNRNLVYSALESGQLKVAKWLVAEQKLNVKHVDSEGENLAHAAAKSNNVDALRWVESQGVDIFSKSKNGKTTLQSAVESGSVVGAEWLVRKKIDFSFDNDGKSTFDYNTYGSKEMENWLKYTNKASDVHDFTNRITKADWNRIADKPVDDIKYIKINPEKLATVLDNTPDLNKRLGLLQVAEKYGNKKELSLNDRLSGYIKRADVARNLDKVQKVSDGLNLALTGKNMLGDIIDEDFEGFKINSANLALTWATMSVSKRFTKVGTRMIETGSNFGYFFKASAPFIGRITDAMVVIELVDKINAYKHGDKDALVRIVGDSTILAVDAAALAAELAAAFGYATETASVLGPFAAALDVAIFIGMDIYDAVRVVDKIDEQVPLTGWEKFSTGFRAFFTAEPSQYIKDLLEIKAANNKLATSAVKYLKEHKNLNRYLFGAAYKTSTGILTVIPDNRFDLTVLRKDLLWDRTKPDVVQGSKTFCNPVGDFITPDQPTYLCAGAIGVEVENKSKENNTVLVELGDGYDVGYGFSDEGHLFIMSDGTKHVTGGKKNDIFFIGKNLVSGSIDGNSGLNTFDFEAYSGNDIVYINPSKGLVTQKNDLRMKSIQRIIGRTKKQDVFEVDCGVQVVEGRGGPSTSNPDKIIVKDSHFKCDHNLILNVSPYTNVKNSAYGDVLYNVMRGDGEINMHFDYKTVGHTEKKNVVIANYVISELTQVERKIENHTLKASFVFEGKNHKNKLNLNLIVENENLALILKDETIYQFNSSQVFALKQSKKHVTDLINESKEAIKKQKVLFIAKSIPDKAFVTINYEDGKSCRHHKEEKDNAKIMPTYPSMDSYMISSTGPNIYEIVPPNPLKVPLNTVYIFNNENNSAKGNTVYMQKLMRLLASKLKLSPRIECQRDGKDLKLQLKDTDQLLLTVVLKSALENNWYKTVEVIGMNSALQIINKNNQYVLDPIPLRFDKQTNYAVLTKDDFEMNSRVELDKTSTGYEFYKLNNDLVITNRFAQNLDEKDYFTYSLIRFYEDKESTLHSILFKFKDDEFSIKEKLDIIEHAENFRQKFGSFMVNFKNYHNIKSGGPRVRRSVGNSASALSSPINTLISWIKTTTGYVLDAITSTSVDFWPKTNALDPTQSSDPAVLIDELSASIRPKTSSRYSDLAQLIHESSSRNTLSISHQIDCNQTLFLADYLVRSYTKVKPYNSAARKVNYEDVWATALELTEQLEGVLDEFSEKFGANVDFDPLKLQKMLRRELVNGNRKSLEKVLLGSVEKDKLSDESAVFLRDGIGKILLNTSGRDLVLSSGEMNNFGDETLGVIVEGSRGTVEALSIPLIDC